MDHRFIVLCSPITQLGDLHVQMCIIHPTTAQTDSLLSINTSLQEAYTASDSYLTNPRLLSEYSAVLSMAESHRGTCVTLYRK